MTDEADPTSASWLDRHARLLALAGLVALMFGAGIAVASRTGESPPPHSTEQPGVDYPEQALVAVKIDNAPAAHPLVGLDRAAVVFELEVEGGLTRLLAAFEQAPGMAGPVRSVRPVDADLVTVLSDTMVSTGGRPFVLQSFVAAGVTMVGFTEFGPQLDQLERPAPHHLFFDTDLVEPTPMPIGIPRGSLPDGADGTTLHLDLPAAVSWTHVDGRYTRHQEPDQFVVAASPETAPAPFQVDTVVVLEAARRLAGYQDTAGAEVPTFDVIGAGTLTVLHGGVAVEGTWSRAAQEDHYVFRDAGGAPFGLPDGTVFVHVVPRDRPPQID